MESGDNKKNEAAIRAFNNLIIINSLAQSMMNKINTV